jgi:hypothetical protein
LAKPPSDYTEVQRKEDSSLLSAALAAVTRGEQAGASSENIAESLSTARYSKEAYHRLYPSVRFRKDYAINRAARLGKDVPEIRSVDDKYIIYTPMTSGEGYDKTDEFAKDPDVYSKRPLPLEFVRHHRPSAMETSLTRDLIQDFLQGVRANYQSLAPHIHEVDGRIILYWVTLSLTGLSWADADDSEVEIVVKPAPTPKHKKRKTTGTPLHVNTGN